MMAFTRRCTARVVAHVRCCATAANGALVYPAGQVSKLQYYTPDLEGHVGFCKEALGMKPKGQSANFAVLGDGTSCAVALKADEQSSSTSAAPSLAYPYLTIGVSNLKTSARKAKRWYGDVVGSIVPAVFPSDAGQTLGPASGQAEATTAGAGQAGGLGHDDDEATSGSLRPLYPSYAYFSDPAGVMHRVLHVYRRNPVISVTMGISDVAAAVAFFAGVCGMRRVAGPELGELYLPSLQGPGAASGAATGVDDRIALAFGHCASTSALVLEPHGTSLDLPYTIAGAARPGSSTGSGSASAGAQDGQGSAAGAAGQAVDASVSDREPPVLTLTLPSEVLWRAYQAVWADAHGSSSATATHGGQKAVWADVMPLGPVASANGSSSASQLSGSSQAEQTAVAAGGFLAEDSSGNVFEFRPTGARA